MDRDQLISRWLVKRKIARWTIRIFLLLTLSSILLDHTAIFAYPGNDAAHFDRQPVQITRVLSADTLCIKLPTDKAETTIHLLGVDAPHPPLPWSDKATTYTTARTKNRTVTLRLDPIGWRNPDNQLLAYLYITDSDNLNLDIIHDAQAYADRRTTHSMHSAFESAETDARKKQRGLWKNLPFNQMPQWRQQWLKSRNLQ
jgi:endonuclease YncB( thermonuclease family)